MSRKRRTQSKRAKRAKQERRAARRSHPERRPDICQSLEFGVRGSYHSNRYFIEMNVDPKRHTATYIHEYWHYLQNISTLHGIKSFLVTQQLLAQFSHTMQLDGTSAGDVKFSADELIKLASWTKWTDRYEGDRGPDGDIAAEVVGLAGNSVTFEALWVQKKKRKDVKFKLGAHAINESIAHIVHRHMASLLGETQPNAPAFPYSVLELLASYLVPEALDPLVIAAVGTIALQDRDPGLAVPRLLQETFAELQRGKSMSDALDLAAQQLVYPYFAGAATVAIDHDLPEIIRIHQGRTSDKAVKYLCEQKIRGLRKRLKDLIFDIRCFLNPDQTDHVNLLIAMMRDEFVPCEMSFDGKILSFHPAAEKEGELDLPQFLRVFQAQQEFMTMHLSNERFRASELLPTVRCPFYSKCTHPARNAHEVNCRTAPWRNYVASDTRCWFTLGVAATVGPGEVVKVLESK